MKTTIQAVSLSAKYDIEIADKELVGIVELKKIDGVMASMWWISGLTADSHVSLMLQMHVGLVSGTERAAVEECKKLMPTVLKMAKNSSKGGGLKTALVLLDSFDRLEFALAHMRLLDQQNLLGDSLTELSVRTARQYELCKSFGITASVELIAKYEQVPVTTIRRRLAKARDLRFLPKVRDVLGDKNGRA